MHGQPVLADADAIDQAAAHHVPADEALQPAEREDPDQPRQQRARNPAGGQQHEERHEKGEADQAAEEAVRPLPPEDALERAKAHALVDLLVLRDLPILVEGILPVGLRQRRHDADDRLPFGDRQAGAGQARRAADADQQEDQRGHRQQPDPHGRGVDARLCRIARQRD